MILRWPWCNGSTRLCESRSMGSIPIGQPSLVIWRRWMRTGFISRGGRIDTFYHYQAVLFGNSVVGNTTDFDSVIPGSNPGSRASIRNAQ